MSENEQTSTAWDEAVEAFGENPFTREEIMEKADRLSAKEFFSGNAGIEDIVRTRVLMAATLDAAEECGIPYAMALTLTKIGLEKGIIDISVLDDKID